MVRSLLSESLHLLRARKLANWFVVELSYRLSRYTGRLVQWGQPYSLSVEPTTACNLGCPQCPTGTQSLGRSKGRFDAQLLHQALDQWGDTLFSILFFLQGEPFLNPQLPELIARARARGIFTMSSTNGHFLTPDTCQRLIDARLHRLVVSVDGADQATYEQYRRGGRLDTVLQGIRHLVQAKKQRRSFWPIIELQFLVFRTNEHQIPQMRLLAKQLGVRLRLKSAQLYDLSQAHQQVPRQSRYARYRQDAHGHWHIKSSLPNHCHRIWSAAVLSWDGQLMPCCFDKDGLYPMGAAHQQALPLIWRGEAFGQFRKQVLTQRANVPMCRNCTEGLQILF